MKQRSKKHYEVSLWRLFLTFLKVGAFTFGGGYAMIAIWEEELVSKKKWMTSEDMLDMIVIAESTPGVIAVNTATSVGYRLHGIAGAIVATIGAILPSFCIIFGLSFAIWALQDNRWYMAAFAGIQACVTVLVVNAFVKTVKQLQVGWFSILLMLASFGVAAFTRFNVIFLILIGGALGVVYTVVRDAIVKKRLPLENVQQNEDLAGQSAQTEAEDARQSDFVESEQCAEDSKEDEQ